MNTSKLSRQQKAIIEYLYQDHSTAVFTQRKPSLVNIKSISRYIAESFNKGHGNRIINRDVQMAKAIESANAAKTTKEIELTTLSMTMWKSRKGKLKRTALTPSHRASMSRSIKRLRDRGLIEGFAGMKHILIPHSRQVKYIMSIDWNADGRERYFRLTERGREAAESFIGSD